MSLAGSPRQRGFRQPAEWTPHRAVWLAWPAAKDLWGDSLPPTQQAFVAMARAIAGTPGGEVLEVLVRNEGEEREATEALEGLPARFHPIPYGDIWMRDIAPLFLVGPEGERGTVRFRFNGWGGKYVLPHDSKVAERVAKRVNQKEFSVPVVLEGGALEVDGEGTCLTTRQCLTHPNRNPSLGEREMEEVLRESLGVEKILWLEEGLREDHTDGHIDNLARFIAPGVVACMVPRGENDPQRDILEKVRADLGTFTDAGGRRLELLTVPSPGRIKDQEDRVLPASHMNFYIGNSAVVIPLYGSQWDDEVVATIGAWFPGRKAVGIDSSSLLTGGGSFHCITQQEPRMAEISLATGIGGGS